MLRARVASVGFVIALGSAAVDAAEVPQRGPHRDPNPGPQTLREDPQPQPDLDGRLDGQLAPTSILDVVSRLSDGHE